MPGNVYGPKARFDALRSLAFGAIGAGYVALGAPLPNAGRLVYVLNRMDADLMFSFDPTASIDHFVVAANGYIIYDFSANETEEDGLYVTLGTQMWVKQVSAGPTSGNVYVTVLFGRQ